MVGRHCGLVAVLALLLPAHARADLNLPDPDVTPPVVTIVNPVDGLQLDGPTTVDVLIEAEDPPGPRGGFNSGISAVWLEVDGVPVTPTRTETYAYSLELGMPGTYELRAQARDFEGNMDASPIVTVTVAGPADGASTGMPSGSSSGTPGEDSSAAPGEGTTAMPPSDDDTDPARGCACTHDRGASTFAWALLALLVRRRRGAALSCRAR